MKPTLSLCAALILLPLFGAARTITIDLAQQKPGQVFTQTIARGEVDEFLIKNALMSKEYSVEILREFQALPTVDIPVKMFIDLPTECDELVAKTKLVKDYLDSANPTEPEFAKLLSDLYKELKKSDCADTAAISAAKRLIAKSIRHHEFSIDLDYEEQITVKIVRDDLVWTYIYKTPKKGQWLVSYGFSFISNAQGQSTYHLRQNVAPAAGYTITKDRAAQAMDLSLIPMINLTYLPNAKRNDKVVWGLNGGIGYDSENLAVSAGLGAMYQRLIGVNLSVLFAQRARLNSNYSNGMVVQENLNFDQLHSTSYYPYVSLGISFRLNSNPFERGAEAIEEQ